MTEEDVHRAIVHNAERLQGFYDVLEDGFPHDNEGFVIHDGSDLSDALKIIDSTISGLTRLAFKISREGIDG